jgi:hypothetical protein
MSLTLLSEQKNPLGILGKLARTPSPSEQCDFCSQPLGSVHRHLLESSTRKIMCVCDACGLRFHSAVGRYKLIPRDGRPLRDFQMTDQLWESFSVPINLAFFVHSTPQNRVVALYPSPGGATESLVPLENWNELVAANPGLKKLQPDIEALLVNRLGNNRQYFIAPIDACFELAGLIRLHWRGFSGGDKVWQEIENFFQKLRPPEPDGTAQKTEAPYA